MLAQRMPPVATTPARARVGGAGLRQSVSHPVLGLQRLAGNRALSTLFGGARLQSKLVINQPGDQYEREADRIAQRVASLPRSPGGSRVHASADGAARLQRCACGGTCASCQNEHERITPLQRSADGSGDAGAAPSVVHQALNQTGRALDGRTRSFMEGQLGRDFGGVRVHDDSLAARSAAAVGAHAYTVGNDVVFAAGQYAPDSMWGRRLLAHELVHVVQQRNAGTPTLVQRHLGPPCPPCRSIPPEEAKKKERWLPANQAIEQAYRDDPKHNGHCILTSQDFMYGGKLRSSVPKGCAEARWAAEFLGELSGLERPLAPDIIDFTDRTFYEIKTLSYAGPGAVQLLSYYRLADAIQKKYGGPPWKIDYAYWYPPHAMLLPGSAKKFVCTQLTDYKLSGTPGLIVYQILDCEPEDEEKKRKRVAAEKKKEEKEEKKKVAPAPVAVSDWAVLTGLAPELRPYAGEIGRRVKGIGKAAPGQRYVIIMTQPLWIKMIGDPRMERTLDLMRVHGMDPKRNPVIGFRNLGWTLVGLTAAAYVVVFWGGVAAGALAEMSAAAGTTAAIGGAATGGAATTGGGVPITAEVLLKLGQAAANDNAVRIITSAAAGVMAIVITTKASAAESVDAVDAIIAVPIERLTVDERKDLSDGSEVTFAGRKCIVVGTAQVPGA